MQSKVTKKLQSYNAGTFTILAEPARRVGSGLLR